MTKSTHPISESSEMDPEDLSAVLTQELSGSQINQVICDGGGDRVSLLLDQGQARLIIQGKLLETGGYILNYTKRFSNS